MEQVKQKEMHLVQVKMEVKVFVFPMISRIVLPFVNIMYECDQVFEGEMRKHRVYVMN